jgi:thioester reductase-like protein
MTSVTPLRKCRSQSTREARRSGAPATACAHKITCTCVIAKVDGTRRVVELAEQIDAGCLHHISSVVVAGDYPGQFDENAFDLGQNLPTPYQRTKSAAERLVRETCTVPWRIYRPSVIVGDSTTGEMDKVDGVYYLLPMMATLGGMPGAKFLPLPRLDLGVVNIVPVDWVADATLALLHRRHGSPRTSRPRRRSRASPV